MAARFFINGGVDNNWGTIGNWSLTSGGTGGQAVPTPSDDVTLDGNSPNCSINGTALRNCKSITATNYTNTLNIGQHTTVSGSIAWGAGMTITGQSVIRLNADCTITSNGKAFPHLQVLNTPRTIVFADPCTINGLFSPATSVNNNVIVLNGSNITVNGCISLPPGNSTAVFASISGTTIINYAGPSGFIGSFATISNTINILKSSRGY